MLEAAGLSAAEEAVYLALLRKGAASADQLASRTQQAPTRVTRAVAGLHRKGLVHRTPPPSDLIVPVPPDLAFDQLIQRRREDLERVREAAQQLSAESRARSTSRRTGELIEIVQGRGGVRGAFERVQHAARSEMRVLVAPPYAATAQVNQTQLARGVDVTYRAVYTTEALAEPGFMAAVSEHVLAGEQARLAPVVPTKLAIADRTLALLPLSWTAAAQDTALLVHPCGLLDALVALFEGVWTTASPLVITGPAEVRPLEAVDKHDRQLLSLLVAGMTDEAAGARLGMSRRTVVRRVQHMMAATGAQSRIQLGWRVRERGWL